MVSSGAILKRLKRSAARRRKRQRGFLNKAKTKVLPSTRLAEAVSITDNLKTLSDYLKASAEMESSLVAVKEEIHKASVFLSKIKRIAADSTDLLNAVLHLKEKYEWKGTALFRKSEEVEPEEDTALQALIRKANVEHIMFELY